MQPPAGYASRLLPLLLSLGFALSCAEERAPINRVQPNALEKKFFVGEKLSDPSDNPEFYYRPTIVDVDYGASQEGLFTASYAQTLSRVGFEITEDLLLARLTYERVEGTSGKGAPDDNAGQIVAAFKILRHFDVQSDYNPQTGEELNIVEENDTDRPWYQRKFMRVDWSQNLITTAYELDTLATLKAYSGDAISYEAAQYYVEDPTSPDAPQFNRNDGYFDVTNKVFAKPQTLNSPWGSIPLCWLSSDFLSGTAPVGNCNPVELKVRLAFKRVVDRDYEPVDWNGQRMSMFGVFTTDDPPRLGYDRNYGVVDAKWRRFAHRHNIWQNSHDRDAQGQAISCRDDSACRVAAGSHCDGYRAQCTLPYRERQIRTVPFYYGPDSDPTLFESARAALSEWDQSVRHAVVTARYAECIHEQGGVTSEDARGACNEQYNPSQENALASVPEIFVFCHNPVVAGDPEACGKAGLSARVGDLRYNMANIIQAPQVPSPWGIMVDGTDPISGEVVAASANLWNAVTDLRTQDVINTMRWYLGELQSNDIIDGNYVKPINAVGSASQGALPDRTSPVSEREIEDRLGAMDDGLAARDARTGARIEAALPAGITAKNLVDWASEETRLQFGDAALGLGNSPIHSRLAAIQGTPVENALINDSFRMLAGIGADEPLNQTTLALASPLRTGFWQNRSALERERQLKLAARGTCTLEAEAAEGTAI
ncbi:MAG TPA: hypothetical protein VFQ61_38615, partial [Polyangiaceae bacterium]|nr:hypothetical protein [Polyangiaceae bacterium]